jgi:hypothetical protein
MKHCYSCTYYSQSKEKLPVRNSAGKVSVQEQYVDRCAARNGNELMVPVVDGATIRLMLRAELVKLIDEAKNQGIAQPFIFGSEAQYIQGSTVPEEAHETIECSTFTRKETL